MNIYKVDLTSCHCGGSLAYLKKRESGAWEMVGCVCHTFLEYPATVLIDHLPIEMLGTYLEAIAFKINNVNKDK